MLILRLILKLVRNILLFPVLIAAGIVYLLVKIGVELSSFVQGGLILFVLGCMIYTLTKQAWEQALVLAMIEAVLFLVTAAAGILEVFLGNACRSVGALMLR